MSNLFNHIHQWINQRHEKRYVKMLEKRRQQEANERAQMQKLYKADLQFREDRAKKGKLP